MWPLYLYAAGGFLTAAGELYCGYLNRNGDLSISKTIEAGLIWPAIVTWMGINLTAERLFGS
jgi:hypothetical protein